MIREFTKGDVGPEVLLIQRVVGAIPTGLYDLQTIKKVCDWKKIHMPTSASIISISANTLQGFANVAEENELEDLFHNVMDEGNLISRRGYEKHKIDAVMKSIPELGNVELKTILAVIQVEAGSDGFADNGRIKIQFEPYWFNHYEGVRIANKVEGQKAEYEALYDAGNIDVESAFLSTSWGLGQVMGFNHKRAGYSDAKSMVMDFCKSEQAQLKGMLKFIVTGKNMLEALEAKDWRAFAYEYNGPRYEKFDYHNRMAKAYENQ